MKNKVKLCRTQINMTQADLARSVDVSSRTIISIETEKYNPSLSLAYRLANLFNTSIEELFCLEENCKKEEENNE